MNLDSVEAKGRPGPLDTAVSAQFAQSARARDHRLTRGSQFQWTNQWLGSFPVGFRIIVIRLRGSRTSLQNMLRIVRDCPTPRNLDTHRVTRIHEWLRSIELPGCPDLDRLIDMTRYA